MEKKMACKASMFILFITIAASFGLSMQLLVDVVDNHLISKACNQTLYYDVCVSSLTSQANSGNADLPGLARISLNVSIVFAKEMVVFIKEIIDSKRSMEGDDFESKCLSDCLEQFCDAVDDLRGSEIALKRNDYESVNTKVAGAMTDSDTCERGFEEGGRHSPLTEKNDYFSKLCSNSMALVRLLV